jgi:bilirubin oxidase
MRFEGDEMAVPELPSSLTTLPSLSEPSASKSLALEESMTGGPHAGHGGGEMMTQVFSINGQVFPDVQALTGVLGTTEEWTIENTTMMDHPFHLHGFRFEVTDVGGRAPEYRALHDTINIPAEQTVTVRLPLEGCSPSGWSCVPSDSWPSCPCSAAILHSSRQSVRRA